MTKQPLTPAQRKAAQRARDKEAGLVEKTVKIRADRVDELRVIEKRLQREKNSK